VQDSVHVQQRLLQQHARCEDVGAVAGAEPAGASRRAACSCRRPQRVDRALGGQLPVLQALGKFNEGCDQQQLFNFSVNKFISGVNTNNLGVNSYPNGVNSVSRVIQTIWCDCLFIVNITLFWCEQTIMVKSTLLV